MSSECLILFLLVDCKTITDFYETACESLNFSGCCRCQAKEKSRRQRQRCDGQCTDRNISPLLQKQLWFPAVQVGQAVSKRVGRSVRPAHDLHSPRAIKTLVLVCLAARYRGKVSLVKDILKHIDSLKIREPDSIWQQVLG